MAVLQGACRRAPGPSIVAEYRCGLGAQALALAPDGASAAVACGRSNDVWILDLEGGASRSFDTSPQPGSLAFHPEGGWLFVVDQALGSVAQVKLADLRVGRRWRGAFSPGVLGAEAGGSRLLVGSKGAEELALVRLRDLRLEKTLKLGGELKALRAEKGQDWLALTRAGDQLVRIAGGELNPAGALLPGPAPAGLSVDGGRGLALVACQGASPEGGPAWQGGGVAVVRLSDLKRLDYLAVEGGPVLACYAPSRERLAVVCASGELKVVSVATGKVEQSLALGGAPGAAVELGGGEVLVALSGERKALRLALGALR